MVLSAGWRIGALDQWRGMISSEMMRSIERFYNCHCLLLSSLANSIYLDILPE